LRRAIAHTRTYLSDCLTPVRVYSRLAERSPIGFLLESVTGGERVSRYSFLGAAPRELLRVFPDRCERARLGEDGGGEPETLPGPPLPALAAAVGAIAAEPGPLPFTGGWVGYFGYDLARLVERLPDRPPDAFGLPAAVLARFDEVFVFDHAHQRVLAVANEIEGEVSAECAEAALERLGELLTAAGGEGGVAVPARALEPPAGIRCGLPGDAFRRGVAAIREEIAAGEIFQAVLARRWIVPRRVPPLALYRALRLINPSPYMVLLELPEVALAGASPEMLVRAAGGRLATRPIAGTRPRSDDPEADLRLAADLAADPKERAEHVMLVDLGRNDLGRVARPGSVGVASFMEVERYSHVMHMVSSVEADLAPGRTALDALLACFPAGTVSGAPKIRAMEILDRLEPEARGPYAGAVGYLSFTGDLDTCITIRTLVVQGEETSVTAGAGIVADSDPAREEEETENKAAALLAAVALAEELDHR
jgi:anthranilate synthase component 1